MLKRRSFLVGCACCAAGAASSAFAQDIVLPPPVLTPIADGVWMHRSWGVYAGAPFGANGLVVVGARQIALIDAGWRDEDCDRILDLVLAVAPDKPILVTGTHAHSDRVGGINAARRHGVPTLVYAQTQEDSARRGLPQADQVWRGTRRRIDLGGRRIEIFHPGAAHTRDNVTVFDEASGTLFGGCMIRPVEWNDLGNVADADVHAWAGSVARLEHRYGERLGAVIPGHGERGGAELLVHTRQLAQAAVAQAG